LCFLWTFLFTQPIAGSFPGYKVWAFSNVVLKASNPSVNTAIAMLNILSFNFTTNQTIEVKSTDHINHHDCGDVVN
jgi:hypothetical protein